MGRVRTTLYGFRCDDALLPRCVLKVGGALSACRLKPGVYLLEQCGMIGFQAEDVVGLRPLNLSRDGFCAHGIKGDNTAFNVKQFQ